MILGNAFFSCGRSSTCGAVSVAAKLRLEGCSGGGGVIDDVSGRVVAAVVATVFCVEVVVVRCVFHEVGEKGFVWL